MKKITSFLPLLLMAVVAITFSSCSDDQEIGSTLEGTWEGRLQVYTYDRYHDVTYEATHTVINFLSDPFRFTKGDGYWIDYYGGSYWGGRNYIANHIRWRVSGRVIYVYFVEDDYNIEIRDYRLSNGHFIGTIYTDDSDVDFNLYKTNDYDWNDYYYGWDYWAKPIIGVAQPSLPERHFGAVPKP